LAAAIQAKLTDKAGEFRLDIGRNWLPTNTQAPATPDAPDRRIFMRRSMMPNV